MGDSISIVIDIAYKNKETLISNLVPSESEVNKPTPRVYNLSQFVFWTLLTAIFFQIQIFGIDQRGISYIIHITKQYSLAPTQNIPTIA